VTRTVNPYNLQPVSNLSLQTMHSAFYRSNSISTSSTSDTSKNKRIVQREEITIEDFTKNIDDWKIPKISQTQIY